MNPYNRFSQGPNEKRLYQQTVNGDTISSATWTIAPSAGVTLTPQTPVVSRASVLVYGLQLGVSYLLSCHIVGATGQEYDSSAQIVAAAP
jgi:hypothetical protein